MQPPNNTEPNRLYSASSSLKAAFGIADDCYGFADMILPTNLVYVGNESTTTPSVSPTSPIFPFVTPEAARQDTAFGRSAVIGTSIAVPVSLIAILALAWYAWRKLKSRLDGKSASELEVPESDVIQPYLQSKAELENEERRKYELGGGAREHELDGLNTINELPSLSGIFDDSPETEDTRQELQDEEHAHEME